MNLTREHFIQKNLKQVEITDEGIVYFDKFGGDWFAQGFSGRRCKPDFFKQYKKKSDMHNAIKVFFQGLEANKKYKEERKRQRAGSAENFIAALRPGAILYDTWGYDQTNVEFFEVKEVDGHRVTLHEIGHDDIEQTSWCSCKVIPKKGVYIGEPIVKIVKSDCVKIDSCVSLRLYHNNPVHKSWGA
jgi:hypothetical protein